MVLPVKGFVILDSQVCDQGFSATQHNPILEIHDHLVKITLP